MEPLLQQQSLDLATCDLMGAAPLLRWPPSLEGLCDEWSSEVRAFLSSSVGKTLSERLRQDLAKGRRIYPPQPFHALALTPLHRVRLVILGQDPYHGPGQAQGLAFSVPEGVRAPPSLRNIFKEIQGGKVVSVRTHGSLVHWAEQGVLLLNTCLTVEEGKAASHARWGWEVLTDALIRQVAQNTTGVVFMLWGAHAQTKKNLIVEAQANRPHLILEANHPSPLSAKRKPSPFLGCNHFEMADAYWRSRQEKTIIW